MSFNWNDISGYSSNKLKEQCKCLNIPTSNQTTRRELINKLQNYKAQMNLNKVRTSPIPNYSHSPSPRSSKHASPIPSRMTPISTTKPSYLSSSHKNTSNKHSSHKKIKSITPANKIVTETTPKNNFSFKGIVLILLIIVILALLLFIH